MTTHKMVLGMLLISSALLLSAVQALAFAERPINPTIAKAPALAAGIAGSFQFAADFEVATGQPLAQEFVGFHVTPGLGQVDVRTYYLSSPKELTTDRYGCNLQQDRAGVVVKAQCQDQQQRTARVFSAFARWLSLNEFEAATEQAILLFETKFAQPEAIEAAKVWQADGNIEYVFNWTPVGQAKKTAYIMCHYHAGKMDCHRQSQPGRGEPQD